MSVNTQWQNKSFNALTNNELYDLLKLRIDVFVVEQECFYPDLDDLDRHPQTRHIFCYHNGLISAYLRILPKTLSYPEYISIGRVIIAPQARGKGLGHELMHISLDACQQYFPDENIKISAQEHLEEFYQQHGFTRVTAMYLEDNIPHIGMVKIVK